MFTDPVKNLKSFGLREDSIVADLGAGTGFYSIAAGMLAPRGKVYAIEIVKDFLDTIKTKIKEAHLKNVEILWGDVEKSGGTSLGDGVVDTVIASNIFFQVQDKDNFIQEVKRILRPKGRVLLVDWSSEDADNPMSLNIRSAIPKDRAREMFEKKGFILEREIDTGGHHYGIILIKP